MLSAKGQATTWLSVSAPSCRGSAGFPPQLLGLIPGAESASTVSFISYISFALVDDVAVAQGRNEQAIDAGARLLVSNSE